MARYVDVVDVIARLNVNKITYDSNTYYYIMTTPTADVTEIIHAKWIISSNGYYPYCSNCKTEPKNGIKSKYCPECGARMDGEK